MSKRVVAFWLDAAICVGWTAAVALLAFGRTSGLFPGPPLAAASPSYGTGRSSALYRAPDTAGSSYRADRVRPDYAGVADGHRWQRLPIRVAILGGWTGHDGYFKAALAGMKQWEKATHGRVKFNLVTSAANADITLRLKYNSKDGYTRIATWGPYMKRGEITLGTLTLSNHVISLAHFQADAVHEFGHALGIIDHSPYPSDIMYPIMDEQSEISPRDLATLNKIYRWGE